MAKTVADINTKTSPQYGPEINEIFVLETLLCHSFNEIIMQFFHFHTAIAV